MRKCWILSSRSVTPNGFWDIILHISLKPNRRFGGAYSLYLEGTISLAVCHLLSRWYSARLICPWRCRRYVLAKRRLAFSGVQGVIPQKTLLLSRWERPWTFFFEIFDGRWGRVDLQSLQKNILWITSWLRWFFDLLSKKILYGPNDLGYAKPVSLWGWCLPKTACGLPVSGTTASAVV
jgi:hypothetical protein